MTQKNQEQRVIQQKLPGKYTGEPQKPYFAKHFFQGFEDFALRKRAMMALRNKPLEAPKKSSSLN